MAPAQASGTPPRITTRSGLRQCMWTSRSTSARDRRDSPADRARSPSRPVQARSVKSSSSAMRTPLPSRISRSPAVPTKPTGLPSAFSASIPASPLVATAVIAVARQPDARELLLDGFGGARRVGDQDDAAALVAPLPQPLGRARIKVHAVVHDAPDVAQDQPVFRIERVPESSFEARLRERLLDRRDIFRIVEFAQRERRRLQRRRRRPECPRRGSAAARALRASRAR